MKRHGLLSPEVAWTLVRLFLGFSFVRSGYEKLAGNFNGQALTGTLTSWINGGGKVPPDPNLWYVGFLKGTVIPHAGLFASLVIYGEILVGIALFLGLLTSIAALAGAFLNLNYYLAAAHTGASTQGINALYIVVQLLFILACVGQYYSVDQYIFGFFGRRRADEHAETGESC